MGSTSKHQKLSEEVKLKKKSEDRISNLPNSLVGHILSFIPTKYAVGTSILSSKWKEKWTSITNLDFDDRLLLHSANSSSIWRRQMSFIKFVYRVLFFLEGSNVNKIRICCSQIYSVSHVDAWASVALSRNVRELDLCIPLKGSCSIPADLFTCNQLVVLKLEGDFVLNNVPRLVCLHSLKTLHLASVTFEDEESVKRLLSGCPVVEDLDLGLLMGKNVSVLNISAPAAKRLIVQYAAPAYWHRYDIDFDNDYFYKIEINTPNLLYLEYVGLVAQGYDMKNVGSSLVKAFLCFECDEGQHAQDYETMISELLQGISNVSALRIAGYCIETLGELSYGFKMPVFHNLTCLELGGNGHPVWVMLPDLLESSPNLRILAFVEGLLDHPYGQYASGWSPREEVPTCLLFHLETVDIRRFRGQECPLTIVKYFLNNEKVLKTLNICFKKSQMQEEEELSKVSMKLLEMTRASANCELLISSC